MENKILWVTGFSEPYFNKIGNQTLPAWKLLSEDKLFLTEFNLENSSEKFINIKHDLDTYYPELQKEIHLRSKKAHKFFKKAFCIWYALTNFYKTYDYIIWLDTDAIVEKSFDVTNFLPNKDHAFSTVIRGENGCDSGFVAFNTRFLNFEIFIDSYIDYYLSGKIWKMTNPWDAYILEDFSKSIPIKNLYIGHETKTLCGFSDTELHGYITHYWGKKGKQDIGLKYEV